jgi:hypothetical protein
MTVSELLAELADHFHDAIDGDDPVESYITTSGKRMPGITVTFKSGSRFWVTAQEIS